MAQLRASTSVLVMLAGLFAAGTCSGSPNPGALKGEIESLCDQHVAWREIPWKTCLLDGLRASRDQNKPVLLWIFIDRPCDDERC
jgi:hypothetical protein